VEQMYVVFYRYISTQYVELLLQ